MSMSNALSCQVKLFHHFKLNVDETFYHALESIQEATLQKDYSDYEYDVLTSIPLYLNEDILVKLDIILYPIGFKLKALFIPKEGTQSVVDIYSLTNSVSFESSKELFKLSLQPREGGVLPVTTHPMEDILKFYGVKEENKCPCCPGCHEPIKEAGITITTNKSGIIDEDFEFRQEEDEEFICCRSCDYRYEEDELNELYDWNVRLDF